VVVVVAAAAVAGSSACNRQEPRRSDAAGFFCASAALGADLPVPGTHPEAAGLQLSGTCDPVVRNCIFRRGYRTMIGGGVTRSGSGTATLEGLTDLN
jgi:hypothetical protein